MTQAILRLARAPDAPAFGYAPCSPRLPRASLGAAALGAGQHRCVPSKLLAAPDAQAELLARVVLLRRRQSILPNATTAIHQKHPKAADKRTRVMAGQLPTRAFPGGHDPLQKEMGRLPNHSIAAPRCPTASKAPQLMYSSVSKARKQKTSGVKPDHPNLTPPAPQSRLTLDP